MTSFLTIFLQKYNEEFIRMFRQFQKVLRIPQRYDARKRARTEECDREGMISAKEIPSYGASAQEIWDRPRNREESSRGFESLKRGFSGKGLRSSGENQSGY